ncbi:MAG: type IV pilus twitching motility protein PilT [Candidatus Dojkabacteria bacterium]
MDQNTAPKDNPQFSYPDFSSNNNPTGGASNTPTPVTSGNQQDEDKKVEELKKSLDQLVQENSQAGQDVQATPAAVGNVLASTEEFTPPPLPETEIPQAPEVAPGINPEQNEAVSEEDGVYVQKPTPLPGKGQRLAPEQTAQVESVVPTPAGEGFDPLPSDLPKFNETLDKIMPSVEEKAKEAKGKGQKSQQEAEQKQRDIDDQRNQGGIQMTTGTPGELTIHQLLSEAVNRNASDLHLSVGYPPILRIDGELINLDENLLSSEDTERLIYSILNDEKKELLEVNREIDFAYTYEGAMNARFRVNAYYSMKNLSAALRLIPSRIKTVEELMLPQIYNQFAKLKQGLILVTGPTGHGKSTTIAAMLEAINRTRFCHIVTIEDPIEYVFEGKKALIDQREMNEDTHSWNIALRSALRQDPDVILVGEMRDFETIASAITLAETGHLVFATLHTNSASQSLDRIIDVFPENQQQQVRTQVANTLEAVIAQRLVPMDSGGRRAVSEVMLNNSAISNMIREGKMHQIDNVIRTSSDIGMIYLERSLVNLVREGVISVQKAQEYAVHPEEVLRLLKN